MPASLRLEPCGQAPARLRGSGSHSSAVRLGPQEQGRAADAGRGDRIPSLAARRGGGDRHRPAERGAGDAPRRPRRAVCGARLQDRRRSVRRQAGLLPGLLRHPEDRLVRLQRVQRPEGAHRAPDRAPRQPSRGDRVGQRRRHRRRGRPQDDIHRRHPVRRGEADHPGGDHLPRAGHRAGGRAQDQGGPGQDGDRAAAPRRGGPDLPGQQRRGVGPDAHRRHGRAAPGGDRRPDAARVQGAGQRRPAPGELPRDDPQAGRGGTAASCGRPAARASTATR